MYIIKLIKYKMISLYNRSDLRQVFSSYFAYVSTTDCHDITEILLKVAFITTNLSLTPFIIFQ